MPDSAPAPTNTMSIWNRVCETDPAHTKQVNQRGGFTSIDAQYQVQRATEVFGPVGEGWGYDVDYTDIVAGDQVLIGAKVTVWHGSRDNHFGPVLGMNALVNDKGRLDDDAPKKALTDALTKALSHLGFSADVFLGRFDDNKYVANVKAKMEAEKHKPNSQLQELLNTFDPTTDTLENWVKEKKAEIEKLKEADKNWLRVRARQRLEKAS